VKELLPFCLERLQIRRIEEGIAQLALLIAQTNFSTPFDSLLYSIATFKIQSHAMLNQV